MFFILGTVVVFADAEVVADEDDESDVNKDDPERCGDGKIDDEDDVGGEVVLVAADLVLMEAFLVEESHEGCLDVGVVVLGVLVNDDDS